MEDAVICVCWILIIIHVHVQLVWGFYQMEEHASKVKLTFEDDAALCYCAYILHTYLVNVQETDFFWTVREEKILARSVEVWKI